MDLIDMTGADGMGWQPCLIVHRCSMPRCEHNAIAYYASTVGGYGWQKQRRHVRHRYVCSHHLNAYGAVHRVIDNRIMREPFEWELERDG
jgi:hypothetical protein